MGNDRGTKKIRRGGSFWSPTKEERKEKQNIKNINLGSIRLNDINEEEQTLNVCLAAVKQNGDDLQYVPEPLKAEDNIIGEALNQNAYALRFVPHQTQKYSEYVIFAVKRKPKAIKYASRRFLENRSNLIYLLAKYPKIFEYLPPEMQGDSGLVLEAIKTLPEALQYASDDLKKDKGFIFNAMVRNPSVLQYASTDLKQDKDLRQYYEDRKTADPSLKDLDLSILADSPLTAKEIAGLTAEEIAGLRDDERKLHDDINALPDDHGDASDDDDDELNAHPPAQAKEDDAFTDDDDENVEEIIADVAAQPKGADLEGSEEAKGADLKGSEEAKGPAKAKRSLMTGDARPNPERYRTPSITVTVQPEHAPNRGWRRMFTRRSNTVNADKIDETSLDILSDEEPSTDPEVIQLKVNDLKRSAAANKFIFTCALQSCNLQSRNFRKVHKPSISFLQMVSANEQNRFTVTFVDEVDREVDVHISSDVTTWQTAVFLYGRFATRINLVISPYLGIKWSYPPSFVQQIESFNFFLSTLLYGEDKLNCLQIKLILLDPPVDISPEADQEKSRGLVLANFYFLEEKWFSRVGALDFTFPAKFHHSYGNGIDRFKESIQRTQYKRATMLAVTHDDVLKQFVRSMDASFQGTKQRLWSLSNIGDDDRWKAYQGILFPSPNIPEDPFCNPKKNNYPIVFKSPSPQYTDPFMALSQPSGDGLTGVSLGGKKNGKKTKKKPSVRITKRLTRFKTKI